MSNNDIFDSSDSVRSGQPLKHAKTVTFAEPLELESGGRLPEVTIAYETFGQLNAAKDNAVLICHALSGDSHVARHDETDDPGWWDNVVGPGKSIDTDKYFVICPNVLGGCRGSTGPVSVNPETGKTYGPDFPVITVGDIVETQRRLVDHLGIARLRAVVGGSLGGYMTLTWATRFPDRLGGAVGLATAPRMTAQALAFDVVARNAIIRDPEYHNGEYYDQGHGPLTGLAIARMLGHITYLSREAMTQKFDAKRLEPREVRTQFETKFSVGSYLAYQGDRFGERFDPNSYLTITMAIDLFDFGATKEALRESFRPANCRWLLVSFSSDWLFPPFQTQQMVDALIADGKPVSFCNIETDCGHDAFLLPNQLHLYGEMVRAFLENLDAPIKTPEVVPTAAENAAAANAAQIESQPTSIFHHRRLDYDSIMDFIPHDARVLDLGCGAGGLLARLRDRGQRDIMGVELDEHAVLACVRRGLNVVQADLNRGLPAFNDGQFDFVILSQTLQTIMDPPRVVRDMLRVGRRAIVSFPNLAFRVHRQQLNDDGRAPFGYGLQNYRWYDTPNVRFLTISDFEAFCKEQGFSILEMIALNTMAGSQVGSNPNLNADMAIAVLGASDAK